NVLTMQMSLSSPRFLSSEAVARLVNDATARIDALPGVEAAATTCSLPLIGGFGVPVIIVGRSLDGPAHGSVAWTSISAQYFDVFRMPILRGRVFSDRDSGSAPPVVVISNSMARHYWPNADPIGQQIILAK